jgi:hypothetical protein
MGSEVLKILLYIERDSGYALQELLLALCIFIGIEVDFRVNCPD